MGGETNEPTTRVVDLEEDPALAIVRMGVAVGDDPLHIIGDCDLGIREVGDRYT